MLTTGLDIAGAGFVVAGIALIFPPAGLIAGGSALLLISWRLTQ